MKSLLKRIWKENTDPWNLLSQVVTIALVLGIFRALSFLNVSWIGSLIAGIMVGSFLSAKGELALARWMKSRGAGSQSRAPGVRLGLAFRFLKALSYLYARQNREHIELIIADLKKDVRDMRIEQRSEWFIRMILLWHVSGTMFAITSDGLRRLAGKALFFAKLIGPR